MKTFRNQPQMKAGCGFLIKTLMPFYLLLSPLLSSLPMEGISQSEAHAVQKAQL